MRVTLDTNVLVRAVVQDDPLQAEAAAKILREAELAAVPVACLCEFVWVLRRIYKLPRESIASALHRLLASSNVVTERAAAEAGLWFHEQGGDFADGAIEFAGRQLGGTTFASFDRDAVSLFTRAGIAAAMPT
jgi:predicted nucleic-acid-binding protein